MTMFMIPFNMSGGSLLVAVQLMAATSPDDGSRRKPCAGQHPRLG